MNNRVTICDLYNDKAKKRPITALSCYDYQTARLASEAGIEVFLAGDSAAQVVLGHDSTLPATMDFMVAITAAVRRAAPNAFLIADMPFLSYQTGIRDALTNAGRFFTESGAQMVKIEATRSYLGVIKEVSDAGMAVMAHIGIRPQMISKIGKFKAEATTAQMAFELIDLAEKMVCHGAGMLLLEATATEVAAMITESVPVPVISCGSGAGCDGQILIAPDILGLTGGPVPKFSKDYGQLAGRVVDAFKAYRSEVAEGKFPNDDHSYHMKSGELNKLRQILKYRCDYPQ